MSTELTPSFKHRKNPRIEYYLEEQFGELQITVDGDGTGFVLRMERDDAGRLAYCILNWVEAHEGIAA